MKQTTMEFVFVLDHMSRNTALLLTHCVYIFQYLVLSLEDPGSSEGDEEE